MGHSLNDKYFKHEDEIIHMHNLSSYHYCHHPLLSSNKGKLLKRPLIKYKVKNSENRMRKVKFEEKISSAKATLLSKPLKLQ